MHKIGMVALGCLLWLAALGAVAGEARQGGFLDRTVELAGQRWPYQVYVPPEGGDDALPVILFLHGAGERGGDGLRQTITGLPAAIRQDRTRFPFLVVMPQAPSERRWAYATTEAAMAALEDAVVAFGGDRERIYVTGLSLGAEGAWSLAGKPPDVFAALVPVSGSVTRDATGVNVEGDGRMHTATLDPHDPAEPFDAIAQRLRHLPVWMLHGDADDVASVHGPRRMRAALEAAGGEVRLTEYSGVGHDAWDRAYAEPDLAPWLLSHRRRAAGSH
ncbi:phospholipase [Luteimonas aestuarii]|uniref:Phospholipase n=1 Tax=Luteimonas aestuarii TaxID=453837 RepID=A0A4R5TTM9_9GAMM|nr:PHB depolymerase family esterase [Luteimonas aestuarii]TDK24374.1 phospholipase [Luteimonas aestuarii]